MTTANLGTVIFNGKEECKLYAVEPVSGIMLAEYDPSDATPLAVGSLTSPAIGANGWVFAGVLETAPSTGTYKRSSMTNRAGAFRYCGITR